MPTCSRLDLQTLGLCPKIDHCSAGSFPRWIGSAIISYSNRKLRKFVIGVPVLKMRIQKPVRDQNEFFFFVLKWVIEVPPNCGSY